MREQMRVDLIFPRSGQIIPVEVCGAQLDWVARRNLLILLSLSTAGSAWGVHADLQYATQRVS
jgi:hypothetical protein